MLRRCSMSRFASSIEVSCCCHLEPFTCDPAAAIAASSVRHVSRTRQLQRWIFGQVEWPLLQNKLRLFVREFFDQNPLSQIGLVTMKDGVANCLTDLGGSSQSHIKALMGKLGCSGDSSIRNALDLVHGLLNQIPLYGHCEVLILYSALSTCDPGGITETIQKCKESKIRCSAIGLSAEMFICKHLCEEAGGSYIVALDESHFKELILEHVPHLYS